MYNIIHHWLLSIDNNSNSRSISVRSKNKTVNKDNVIRMYDALQGAADRISFNYQWITSFGHLFDSKCQNIGKKKKRKKEMEGLSVRVTQINHAQFSVLIFVPRRVTVLLARGVQKEEKARWRVRSSRLVVWSVQGRPSGSIKASVGYAAARPQKVVSVWETSFCNWID